MWQQVVDGIGSGSIYAALAIALVLVYRATGVVNFAQGQMAVLSAYIAWSLTAVGVPVGAAIAATVGISLVIGSATERVVIRRFEGQSQLVAIVVTVALLITVNGLVSLWWGDVIKQFPGIFPGKVFALGPLHVATSLLGTVGVLLLVIVVLQLVMMRTRLGLALRAAATNPGSSALAGLPVGPLLMVGWALAAAVGAVSGCLVAPTLFLTPGMMDTVLVYALAAAVLGGLESPLGAVVAAWVIGVAQNLAGSYLPFVGNDLQIAVPLVLMCLVLLVRPQGIFGRKTAERV
ncbi:MAG: branched-chain amino acid ABC transporter permease [Streptosporangiaceae bacterium]